MDEEEVEAVQWVDPLQEATGWREPRWECDWAAAESALGTSLPADYKELCDRFGPGYFSSSHFKPGDFTWDLQVMLPDQGPNPLLRGWQKSIVFFRGDPDGMESLFTPYELYGVNGRRGLIQWGRTDTDWNFFWLADAAADPDTWPVMVKAELVPDEEWYRYGIPVSEFVYRVVTDPEFDPFNMAYPQSPPTFQRFEGFGPEA